MAEEPAPESTPKFQPRVEAEEGDPTRGDFIIAGIIVVVVAAGLLWAFGFINWP